MILYHWRGANGNFGDELNTLLWPALLPSFFDDNPAERFLGIGSILDRRHPPDVIKLVAGSGYGGYEALPKLDRSFVIRWVRGPRTAAALGLPTTLGLGDPAALVADALALPVSHGSEVGFMPHFESIGRGAWAEAAALAGMTLIDPRDPPMVVLDAITRCRLLLSEALHGAIVADALRVPWIAMRPHAAVHRAKWQDWGDSVGLTVRFRALPASTGAEWAASSCLSTWHTTRQWVARNEQRLMRLGGERRVVRAGQALRATAAGPAQLSEDAALNRCRSRMLEAVRALRLLGPGLLKAARTPRSGLQPGNESAYELVPTN